MKFTRWDVLFFVIGLLGGPFLYLIVGLLFFSRPKCPMCAKPLKKMQEKCNNCNVLLEWREL